MKKFSIKSKYRARNSKRQELEVNILLVLLLAAVITVGIYALLLPFRSSFVGILIYERGITQPITIAMGAIVISITVLKFISLRQEYDALSRIWIADHIPLDQPFSPEVAYFQERLTKDGNLVALRCSRIVRAYMKSGDRATANEFALDDSSFYLSASESSYSLPRILVWAIPLLGFIGTVVGISAAVSGFSEFLEESGDVEQIKEGIGLVTGGLAVAFDTTLLALFLSVLVMIPLVLVERYESRLLLGIDVFINDKLLPRLKAKTSETELNVETIERSVKGAIDEHFPDAKDLVEPANTYAEQAAIALAKGFLERISQVQDVNSQVIAQVQQIKEAAERDRTEFLEFFERQQQANQELIASIKATVEEIRSQNMATAATFDSQVSGVSLQLEQAAQALENRVAALEQATNKVSDLRDLQQGLDRSFQSLEKTAQLEQVLVGVKEHLAQLTPVLNQLNKPRRITLVEQDSNNIIN
ncbi:MAG: MotA/TolQ/ExbB proton channel family protein [Pleurocapsa sp.]